MSVTLNNYGKMANMNTAEFYGKSTDGKPTEQNGGNIINGSIYVEIDTGRAYFYDAEMKMWTPVTPPSADGTYTKEQIDALLNKKMSYYIVTVDGNKIVHEGETLTYAKIQQLYEDESVFIYMEHAGLTLIPSVDVDNSIIAFSSDWMRKEGAGYEPFIYVVQITSDNTVTSQQFQIEDTANKATVINSRNATSEEKYPSVKAVVDYVDKDGIDSEITDIKEDLSQVVKNNRADLLSLYGGFVDSTQNGVSIKWNSKGNATLTGQATGYANFSIVSSTTELPSWLKQGEKYRINLSTTDEDVVLQVFYYVNGSIGTPVNIASDREITIPTDCTGIIVRVRANNNSKEYNAEISFSMFDSLSNKEMTELINEVDTKTEQNKTNIETLTSDVETIKENAIIDFLKAYGTMETQTLNGVTFEWIGNSCDVIGTATAHANHIILNKTELPKDMKTGVEYPFIVEKTGDVVVVELYYYTESGSLTLIKQTKASVNTTITIPDDAKGIYMRLRVVNGNSADEKVTISFRNQVDTTYVLKELGKRIYAKDAAPYAVDKIITLADIREDGFYIISSTYTVTDAPDELEVTGLTVENFKPTHDGGFVKQTVESIVTPKGNKRYFRISKSSGAEFSEWVDCSGGGGSGETINNYYTNEYSFPHTENTYNVTATPNITTDTNNFLASTNNKTDVTTSIVSMLETTGVCHLGTGVFYVKDLVMPDNSMIIGSGMATKIYLLGGDATAGFAIKMKSNCVVKDLMILGAESNISLAGDLINRHGILWEGDATEHGTSNPNIPVRSTIENVHITWFKGGGITLNDTGYGGYNCINVINSYIYYCRCGVNIAYWSEFNRFTGLHISQCYYGVINNGGNNMFSNCSFSNNTLGMLMDNQTKQSPNNTHGSVIGCVFNHSGGNTGTGIKILNCPNGFIFSGCQCFYSKIELEDTQGIVFSSFDFGTGKDGVGEGISIKGCTTILFSDCLFGKQPALAIENSTNVKFRDCYVRNTGAEVTG